MDEPELNNPWTESLHRASQLLGEQMEAKCQSIRQEKTAPGPTYNVDLTDYDPREIPCLRVVPSELLEQCWECPRLLRELEKQAAQSTLLEDKYPDLPVPDSGPVENPLGLLELSPFLERSGLESMIEFVKGNDCFEDEDNFAPHTYWAKNLRIAYIYDFLLFADLVIVGYADYLYNSDEKRGVIDIPQDDMMEFVQILFVQHDDTNADSKVNEQLVSMRELFVRWAISHHPLVADSMSRDIPGFASSVTHILAHEDTKLPDPRILLEGFCFDNDINFASVLE